MTDSLDLLLGSVREPEPVDDAFVMRVMAELSTTEIRRRGRRGLRHPMIIGISAAIVVTGGAVAAVVGTNPRTQEAPATQHPTIVTAADEPEASSAAPRVTTKPDAAPAPDATAAAAAGKGYSSDHASFVLDEDTGVLLQTETYTADFAVDRPQRVTLTLTNTGEHPVAFEASEGCALQVMAYGSKETPDTSMLTDPGSRFEWECAGSDADPRARSTEEAWVLAPGERRTADAFVVLHQEGEWAVRGVCRCSYEQVKPTPVPKKQPLAELTLRALPSPLLPEQPDGKNLVTPAIAVRAE